MFSIVIPTHRRPDLLRACLQAVAQHAPPDCEVVVVDDGSAAAEASRIACGFAGVRVVRLPRARGFCTRRQRRHPRQPRRHRRTAQRRYRGAARLGRRGPAPFADPLVAAVAPLC